MTFKVSNVGQYTVQPNKKECSVYLKYTLTKGNGAVYKVVRLANHIKTKHGKVSCKWEATAQKMKKVALHCEAVDRKTVKPQLSIYKKLAHKKELIRPPTAKPPAKAKTSTEDLIKSVKALQTQINILKNNETERSRQLEVEKGNKQTLLTELRKTQKDVEKLTASVNILLGYK